MVSSNCLISSSFTYSLNIVNNFVFVSSFISFFILLYISFIKSLISFILPFFNIVDFDIFWKFKSIPLFKKICFSLSSNWLFKSVINFLFLLVSNNSFGSNKLSFFCISLVNLFLKVSNLIFVSLNLIFVSSFIFSISGSFLINSISLFISIIFVSKLSNSFSFSRSFMSDINWFIFIS